MPIELRNLFSKKGFKPTESLGVGATAIWGGYIQTKEKNADLVGMKRYTKFSQALVNVAIVGAGVRYFLNLIAKASWSVVPADSSDEAKKLAENVDSMLYDMESPWAAIVRRAAMYRFYGFSIQEWIAKNRDDGVIGLKNIASRPQSTIVRWEVAENGDIKGMYQQSPQTQKEIFLPRGKVIYIVDDSLSDSPEGLGLFRHIIPHADRLERYEELEGYGFENDLRGIPIGRAPLALLQKLVEDGKLTAEKKAVMENALKEFIQSHIRAPETGLLLDSLTYQSGDESGSPSGIKQWDLEVLRGESNALSELETAINRIARNIAILLGVENLLLGSDSRGSYALARDKTHNFFLTVDSTLNELGECFERDLLGPLWELNGWDVKLKPEMNPESIKFRDIDQITGALASLAQAGAMITPADPVVNEIRDLVGLARQDEDATAVAIDASMMVGKKPEPPKEETPKTESVQKYSEDQSRDDHGRFSGDINAIIGVREGTTPNRDDRGFKPGDSVKMNRLRVGDHFSIVPTWKVGATETKYRVADVGIDKVGMPVITAHSYLTGEEERFEAGDEDKVKFVKAEEKPDGDSSRD